MELNGDFYINTCVLPGRHKPCFSPCALVVSQARSCDITSSSRAVAQQIVGMSVGSDTAIGEADRMFVANDIFSEVAQGFNLNNEFDSLQSTFPPIPSPVQNKSPDLEGRSVCGDHFSILLPKPSIMKQPGGIGRAGKRKVTDAGFDTESRVLRRKYLVSEQSKEANSRVSPSVTVPNSYNGEIDIVDACGNEIEVDEFRPQGFPSDVEYEQQENKTVVGDPYSVAENYEDLYRPGDEVLLKTMGWFLVEEYSNEDNNPYALRWILDEPPTASDLPHLESLLEISPSKFWSPVSEPKKRHSAPFGYICCSESPQSSHSIKYFINDSPASSPEVTGAMLDPTPIVRISSKKASHQCSPACSRFHDVVENIYFTPARMPTKPMKASMRSPSLGSHRKLAGQLQEGVPDMLPAFLEENSEKNICTKLSMASPVHQDHAHYQETGCETESAARRLQRGKNLVKDFLKVGTTQEKSGAKPKGNDIMHTDTTLQQNSTLGSQFENTTVKMREKCPTRLSIKGGGISLLSSSKHNFNGGDENCLIERDSSLLRSFSSPPEILYGLQGDHNFTSKTDGPLVASSETSNHPNVAKRLRNSLREKISSQLLFAKPVSESVKSEHLVTVQCPEVAPDNIAWSATGVLRVSRKRSSRVRKPKLKGVELLNRFGNGEGAQPARSPPNQAPYTSKRRKGLNSISRTFEEPPKFRSSVKFRQIESELTSDCEAGLQNMPMQEGRSPAKTPTLSRIVNPLSLLKTSPSKGMITRLRIKPILEGRGLPNELRKLKPLQVVKNSTVKHPSDVNNAVLMSGKNPGEATLNHELREESVSILSADCEISKIPALRSSKYRGVTRHRHTGRFEAHLWDNSRMKLGLAKRGTQVYLGAYSDEDQAAKAHDLAALKYWGPGAFTNFPLSLYEEELRTMENLTKEQFVVILRRRSSGFTRGISKYRGVTRHHQEGRWEARIGRHSGAKYQYLGTYETQEEAAAAYDRAAVRHRGIKAITNFDISNYINK